MASIMLPNVDRTAYAFDHSLPNVSVANVHSNERKRVVECELNAFGSHGDGARPSTTACIDHSCCASRNRHHRPPRTVTNKHKQHKAHALK